MLRTFSDAELDEMCKKRPEGYRADVTGIARRRQDGMWELDTDSLTYNALRQKYLPRPPEMPRFNPDDRARVTYEARKRAASAELKNHTKLVDGEGILRVSEDLVKLFGPVSTFAIALGMFRQAEKNGGCRSCARRAQLNKLYGGFMESLTASSVATRKLAEAMFPDTIFVSLSPTQIKWSDITKDGLDGKPLA
jgi:hypothetical protein